MIKRKMNTKTINNKKGMSLTELVIALGMMAFIVFGTIKFKDSFNKGNKKLQANLEIQSIMNDIKGMLSKELRCTNLLSGKNPKNTNLNALGTKFSIGRLYDGVRILKMSLSDTLTDEVNVAYGTTNFEIEFDINGKKTTSNIPLLITLDSSTNNINTCSSLRFAETYEKCGTTKNSICFQDQQTNSTGDYTVQTINYTGTHYGVTGWLNDDDL